MLSTRMSLQQFGRFFLVGFAVGVVAILTRELIAQRLPADTPIYYSFSVIVVYAFGIILSFVLHSRYTFAAAAAISDFGKFARFVAVALVGAVTTWLISLTCRYGLKFEIYFGAFGASAAFAIGSLAASALTYALNAHLVFVVFGRGRNLRDDPSNRAN